MTSLPLNLILLLAAFLLFQVGILVALFFRPVGRGTASRRLAALALIEGLCVVSIAIGAYLEPRWRSLSNLSNWVDSIGRGARLADTENDPGLRRMLQDQAPTLPRPAFEDVASLQIWQEELRRRLRREVFGLDVSGGGQPAHAVLESKSPSEGVVRELVRFTGFDGTAIPAYLFIPEASEPRAAVLVVPGHVHADESGIAQTAGLEGSYQHAAALRLAEAGFVTLTPELRGFGTLGAPFDTEHRLVAYNAILAGRFYKAIIAEDLKRAVDLLQARPEVDPMRIGIAGASFGGEMAVTYAALDPRIKVVVFQAHGGDTGVAPGVLGTWKDQPHYCHLVPGQNLLFLREDIFLLLAPRPTLGVRGDQEPFRNTGFETLLYSGWEAFGRSDHLELRTEPGGHEFFVEPASSFFKRHL